MRKIISILTFGLISTAVCAWGQSPAAPSGNSQINLQFLAEVLRTAATFHDLAKNLSIQGNLNVQSGGSANQTAAMMGAGAGAGAAIAEMAGSSQKGVLIGVIAGTAGGLVVDQILRHKAEKAAPVVEPRDFNPPELKQRP